MSDESEFDETALARLRKLGGDGFVRKMIDLFFDYAPKRLADARAGEQAGDLAAVAKAVHPLKSSAGQLGARRVSDLCAQIEKLAADDRSGDVPPLLSQLEAALAVATARLERERTSTPP